MQILAILALFASGIIQVGSGQSSAKVTYKSLDENLKRIHVQFSQYREQAEQSTGKVRDEKKEKLKSDMNEVLLQTRPEDRNRVGSEILREASQFSSRSVDAAYSLQQLVANSLLNSLWTANLPNANEPNANDPNANNLRTIEFVRKLLEGIKSFEQTAVADAKLPPAHAVIVRLNALPHLASYVKDVADQLDQCAVVNDDVNNSLWPGFRAAYWNLRGKAAANHYQYSDAYRAYGEAARIQTELANEGAAAEIRSNLATLSKDLGDFTHAGMEWSAARDVFMRLAADKDRSSEFRGGANGLRLLTDIYLTQPMIVAGDYQSALKQLNQVLAEPGNYPAEKAMAQNEKGMCLYSMGRFPEAAQQWEAARESYQSQSQPAFAALVDVNLGWCAYSRRDAIGAEKRFRAALLLPDSDLGPERRAEVRAYLARVLVDQRKFDEARDLLHQALDASEAEINSTLRTSLSERDRQAYLLKLRSHTEQSVWPGVFDSYLELAPGLGISTVEQYQRVLRWKGTLGNSSTERDPTGGGIARQQLVARRDGLLQNLRALAIAARKLEQNSPLKPDAVNGLTQAASSGDAPSLIGAPLNSREPQGLSTVHEAIRAREQEIGGIDREIRRIDENSDRSASVKAIDIPDITGVLTDRSALLDIVVTSSYLPPDGQQSGPPQHTIGFLLEHSGTVSRIELGDANKLAVHVTEFTTAITNQEPLEESRQPLDEMLCRPIQKMMPAIDLLYVSGDGWLHRVPLGALSGKAHPFWIEEVAFAQVASAQSLVRRHRKGSTATGALIVGGLDYGTGQGQLWGYLYGSLLESEQLEGTLRKRYDNLPIDFLVADQCDKVTLMAKLRQCRIAHLATHGYFADRAGDLGGIYDVSAQLDSGLVLSNANRDPDFGEQYLLTAEELGREDLSGIDLLVLSACDTGLGHLSRGEGIIGLLGALDRAGVRSVASALWPVDDSATMKLMDAFYRHCLDGDLAHPAQAMRRAQMEMLRGELPVEDRVETELGKPFFWAAWAVMGWSG